MFLLFGMVALITAAVLMVVRDVIVRRRLAVAERLESQVPLEVPRLSRGDEAYGSGLTGRIDRSFNSLVGEIDVAAGPEAAFLMLVALGVSLAGVLFLWREDLFLAEAGMIVGMLVGLIVFLFLRARRRKLLREQFPDAVDLLARSIRAGETLDQAVETVGNVTKAPLGTEFRRCARHLDMGLSVDAAMQGLVRRAPIFETRILAATLMVQRRTGGNLPLTLERLARVVRDRLSYYRQFRAATAAGRLSALVIALAGPLLVAYMMTFQPDYIEMLFTTRLGQILLGLAITLQVIGIFWIWRLVRTDY